MRVLDATSSVAYYLHAPDVGVERTTFSPDGQLVAGFSGTSLYLWSTATRSLVVPPLVHTPGITGSLWGAVFSPGGDVISTLAIYDTMQVLTCPIATYCVGQAASGAAVLLAGGTKGKRHALPNAIVPTIQVIALNLAWLAGGIVVIEFLFNYPGIGSGLVTAVESRDVPVIQAIVLLIAGLYVVLNLIADILTILASPRLRTGLK